MADPIKAPAFSPEYYEKAKFRNSQAELPYPEKVRQIVAMQRRLVPIYARRGITITPWRID